MLICIVHVNYMYVVCIRNCKILLGIGMVGTIQTLWYFFLEGCLIKKLVTI